MVSEGKWEPGTLDTRWVDRVERFVPAEPGPVVLRVAAPVGDEVLTLHLDFADLDLQVGALAVDFEGGAIVVALG